MAIPYWYPSEYERIEKHSIPIRDGRILLLKTDSEPYEISVDYRGWNYRIVFGTQGCGHFMCIPRLHLGAELAGYDDTFWNTESLLNAGLSEDLARLFARVLNKVRHYF